MLNFAPQLLRSLIMINYYHHSEPFSLELGGQLDALRIAYHTYGTLNADKSNVIWVCHALTGNSDVQDWWPHTVEEGKFLDPADNFIICANILGSPYGTTAPLHTNPATGSPYYKDFPPYTIPPRPCRSARHWPDKGTCRLLCGRFPGHRMGRDGTRPLRTARSDGH